MQCLFNLSANKRYLLSTAEEIKEVIDDNVYNAFETSINDLAVSIVADTFRVAEVNSITIFYKNKSSVKNSAEIELSFNNAMKLQYAYPAAYKVEDQTIVWKLKNLAAYESGIITLNLLLPLDATLINTSMKLNVKISNNLFDEQPGDNEVLLERVIK